MSSSIFNNVTLGFKAATRMIQGATASPLVQGATRRLTGFFASGPHELTTQHLKNSHCNDELTYRLIHASSPEALKKQLEKPLNTNFPRPGEKVNTCVKQYLKKNAYSNIFGGCRSFADLIVFKEQNDSLYPAPKNSSSCDRYVIVFGGLPEGSPVSKITAADACRVLGISNPFHEQEEVLHVAHDPSHPDADFRKHIRAVVPLREMLTTGNEDVVKCVHTGNSIPREQLFSKEKKAKD